MQHLKGARNNSMNFSLQNSILILERTPNVLSALLTDLPIEWTSSNEGENTWSPFDILGHLIHGEETDWIPRTEIILKKTGEPFTPFDRFAQFEKSKDKTLTELLDKFQKLRKKNILKLKGFEISDRDLELIGTHPELGAVSLKNLLAAWTAHDLSHISQITRVMAKQYKGEVGIWTEYMKIMH